eukprot:SAG31_NODE_595_length_13695_cov_11.446896_11_plen_86_part_00
MLVISVVVIIALVSTPHAAVQPSAPPPDAGTFGAGSTQVVLQRVLIDSRQLPDDGTPERMQFVSDFRDQLATALSISPDNIRNLK